MEKRQNMTLEKFNYLTMLCEEQNVTRAAQRLFITQPTLTAFINNLEKSLGFRIFDRSHNPVVLTRSGKVYMDRMRRLLLDENQMIEEIRRMDSPRDTIRIGIGQIHSEMWSPELIRQLLERWPDLNVELRESQEMRLMEYLRDDEIDVILGHLQIDTVNFCFETILEEDLVIAIPENLMPGKLLAGASENGLEQNSIKDPFVLRPEVLSDMPLIQPARSQGLFLNLKQLMDQYQIRPPRVIQTANMIAAASMVKMGLGYMYLSPQLFDRSYVAAPQKIYYCTLPRLIRSRKYYIGYKEHNPNFEQIMAIRDIMLRKFGRVPGDRESGV